MQPQIKSRHRRAYREGKFDEIPGDVLALLKEQEPQSKQAKASQSERKEAKAADKDK